MNYKTQKFLNKITFGLTEMGADFSLSDIWYNLKNGISNLRKFFWVVWKYRGWDFHYNLEVFAKTIEIYLEESQYSPAMEIEKSRIPKEQKMVRVLELINNRKRDDFMERTEKELGLEYPYKDFKFKETEKNGIKMFQMIDDDTEEEKKLISKLIHHSNDLEQAEWNEIWDIIKKDAQGWWT